MDLTLLWKLLAAVLVIGGIIGTVIPALPGSVLVLGGLVLAAWADAFETVGWPTLAVLTVIAALTYVVDFLASLLGAKKAGAHPRAIWGATLGAIAGIFFGLPGFILGPFLGAMLAQLSVDKDIALAGKVGVGAWLGMAVGTAIKLALCFLMLGLFAFQYLR